MHVHIACDFDGTVTTYTSKHITLHEYFPLNEMFTFCSK